MTRDLASGADVTVTLRCNNRCVFCPRSTLRHISLDRPTELEQRLDAIRKRSDRVILTGGELTVLPEAVELVDSCRRRGFREIALITNGRRLSDLGFTRRLVDAGLTEVCVTVYDLRPAVQDGLTRAAGSLSQTLAGLDNLLAIARERGEHGPLALRINTVLCEANVDGLLPMLREMRGRGLRGFLVADGVLAADGPAPLPVERIRAVASDITRDPALAGADVVWRGFPLCFLDGIEGLVAEPHRIDTADADDRRLDEYQAAFRGHFVRAAACDECTAVDDCSGLQQRFVEHFGEAAARPRSATQFEPWTDPGRLAVTPTLACQLRCGYCGVQLDSRHAEPRILDRAVDLLLTSSRLRLELQFFGGEPLLRRDEVLRTMQRADEAAEALDKELLFTVTTNGLLLDEHFLRQAGGHRMRVLFSLDGGPAVMARQRPPARLRDGVGSKIESNLAGLITSGVPYFVNVVATPGHTADLPQRIAHLANLGVTTVQLCYATGPGWTAPRRAEFCRALASCVAVAERCDPPLRLQNLGARAEPTVLSNDLLVDVDGVLYGDAAVFAEGALPGLRDAYRIGHVDELSSFDGLRRGREQNLAILRREYRPGTPIRRRLERHLALGREVQATLDRLAPRTRRWAPERDSNPLLSRLLGGSLAEQQRWIRRRPEVLALPLLHLVNRCEYDCIFCRNKELEDTPKEKALSWLAGNESLGLTRLGLVGNEPLAHPDIDSIIDGALGTGFRKLEVMTTAAPLADRERLESWRDAGMDGFTIPLFGPDAATHDAITRSPGSFQQTRAVLERLVASGADVHVHANVLRQNLERLDELERLVTEGLGAHFCLIPVRPKAANLPYDALVPSYTELIEKLSVRSLVAFPRCVAARIQGEALPDAAIISDLLKVYVLDQPFVQPARCRGCGWRGSCVGTFEAHLAIHGEEELRAVGR